MAKLINLDAKYLGKEDVEGDELILTIKEIFPEDVEDDEGNSKTKWVISFSDSKKKMVINATNRVNLIEATGSDDTDDMTGKRIALYVDAAVMYAGKRVGGLRIRPKNLGTKLVAGKDE